MDKKAPKTMNDLAEELAKSDCSSAVGESLSPRSRLPSDGLRFATFYT